MANPNRKQSKADRAKAMQELIDRADRAKALKAVAAPAEQPKAPPAPAEPTDEERCGREIQAALNKYGMTLRVVVTGTEVQVVRAQQ